MKLRDRLSILINGWPKADPAPQRGLTAGINTAEPRRIEAAAWMFSGATGSFTDWGGQKFPGSLNYPSLWSANYTELRRRSRIAYWDSMQARSLLRRLVDNEVSSGLTLESQPIWDLLDESYSGDTDESVRRRQGATRGIEVRFHLWANSRDADSAGRMTFYQLQEFARLNKLRDGEIFVIFRYSLDQRRQNPLNLQFVPPEQVRDPDDQQMYQDAKARGNAINHGIEWSPVGEEVAYYVTDAQTGRSVRIPKRGPRSGRIYVVHDMIHDSVGQPRGIPRLAHLAHEIQKITDYTVAEIEAAIINALYVLFISPSENQSSSRALTGVMPKNNQPTPSTDVAGTGSLQTGYVSQPGMIIERLKAGESIETVKTERPNVNYKQFVDAIAGDMASSLNVPPEVLRMTFNSNYSASKAAIEMFWNEVSHGRSDLAAGLLNPVYEMWMEGEIAAGEITVQGWGSPRIRRAWLNCQWVGISKPSVDPLKEAKAATARIDDGLTTREREAKQHNGTDFWDNVKRLGAENRALGEAGGGTQQQAGVDQDDLEDTIESSEEANA
ncbi:MAG: phage portal protein [Spirochaetota bacterium]